MKTINIIESATVYIVQIPLVIPFETSFKRVTHKEALLLKLSSEGDTGWGESVASFGPYYSYETNQTVLQLLRDFLIPALKEKRDFTIGDYLQDIDSIRGHSMAKATVENALLDLVARQINVSVGSLIGGKKQKVPSGISIGLKDDMDQLINTIAKASDAKYHRIKLKIKRGKEKSILTAVRSNFPHIQLMVDANGDYTLEDLHLIKEMDNHNLMMIEQPLHYDDIYFHSLLQKEVQTPLCLDESIRHLRDAETAARLGSGGVINIKQGRVGGILKAKKLAEFCVSKGIRVWSGGMLETGIGRAFNIQLQTLETFDLPGDTSETSRYFHEDIADPPVVLDQDGSISVSTSPGTGVTLNEKKLKKFQVHYEKLY